MRNHYLGVLAGTLVFLPFLSYAETLHVSTPGTSLVIDAEKGKKARFLYYGERLADSELPSLVGSGARALDLFPAYGVNPENEAAVAMTHVDGNMTLDLVVGDTETKRLPDGTLTVVTLRDKVYPVDIRLNYRTYDNEDVIETWTETVNGEKGEVVLRRFDSGYLPVRYGDVWLSSLYGAWANEGRLEQAPLTHGMKVIKNKDGVRNSHTAHSEVMLSLDGKPRENDGRVIGAALCYSGNYELRIDTDHSDYHHFFAGINPDDSEYRLAKGETFTTPPLALTYSDQGLSGVSRNFHKWGRERKIAHGTRERKILLNSWEGVYFDVNQEGMDAMMADIASMGGELFVMDDGWFGVKYPRSNDSTSLGDWTVDTKKLPSGIQGLLDSARKHGVRFGIWIEPEMVNSLSELYEKHPEYVVKAAKREPTMGRGGTQMVLDMANPKVQDLVFNVVDTLLTQYPEIDYIKWDANAPIMDHGSQYLPADKQSHLYHAYHEGFAKTMDRIRAKYPDVTIQACGGGGGRANYGVLPWFDEFWVSDNTDALQRVYMQWGTSYFYPAVAMGSHISATPNHQTFRTIPLKYRADVAMSGRLGMEIQPKNMTEDEKEFCRQAIAAYKEIRPVVQLGDIYRLLSPYDHKGVASLMYVAPDKNEGVFYWYKTETFVGQQLPRIPMAGLDPDKMYTVTELNRIDNKPLPFEGKTFSGRYLMSNGLEIPAAHSVDYHKQNDWASRILRLQVK